MSKNKTKNKKRQAKLRAQKRRERLKNMVFVISLFVCIAMVVCMPMMKQAEKKDNQSWYVKGGTVEIAGMPMTANYTPPQYTPPQYITADYTTADSGEAGSAVHTLPIQTGRPLVPEVTATPIPTATPTPIPEMPEMATVAPLPTVKSTSITITAVGDCTLGGNVTGGGDDRFHAYVKRYGYDYFFANVRSLFENDDLTIVNLEGPLTNSKNKRSGRTYNFRGKPEYVNILSGSSVEIANVANNHALDFGESGLAETAQVLTKAGIGVSGFSRVYSTEVKGVKVTSIGFTKWQYSQKQIVKAIEAARKNCDLLIVSMHWGEEGVYKTSTEQRSVGHAAIDAGADIVIGHHPHVFGGIEEYKGKYIVYSLGNFCFGGNGNPSDKRCLIFQQTFNVDGNGNVSNGGINIIPAAVTGVSGKNNFQPIIMPAERGTTLLKNVAKYSKMSLNTTDWMKGSYMEKLGYVNLAA